VADASWPTDQYGGRWASGMRSAMLAHLHGVAATVGLLGALGKPVLGEPAGMPWGERGAYVADADDNPVAVAAASPGTS
jgi:lactoylglutathione lyase